METGVLIRVLRSIAFHVHPHADTLFPSFWLLSVAGAPMPSPFQRFNASRSRCSGRSSATPGRPPPCPGPHCSVAWTTGTHTTSPGFGSPTKARRGLASPRPLFRPSSELRRERGGTGEVPCWLCSLPSQLHQKRTALFCIFSLLQSKRVAALCIELLVIRHRSRQGSVCRSRRRRAHCRHHLRSQLDGFSPVWVR